MAERLSYSILIEKRAAKEAEAIPAKARSLIDKTILALAINPRPKHSKKLTDKEGYRIRLGHYRLLYTIDDRQKIVVIYRIKIKSKATYR
jgi:mRNA interferase RelE/StbE